MGVMAVRPTPGYGTMGIQPLQMNALKMRDPYNLLLGANLESAYGRGPLMLYNWRGNFFEVLGNGTFGLGTYTSHDLQYVSAHMYDMHLKKYFNGTDDDAIDAHVGGGQDRVFRPSTTLNLIFAEDVATGKLQRTIGPFDYARTSDMNHFQLLENGIVVVNGRSSGSWRKYDMKTQKTCGRAVVRSATSLLSTSTALSLNRAWCTMRATRHHSLCGTANTTSNTSVRTNGSCSTTRTTSAPTPLSARLHDR